MRGKPEMLPVMATPRNAKVLFLTGTVLVIIGFIAAFYHTRIGILIVNPFGGYGTIVESYPYQSLGVTLILAGLVFLAAGFLYVAQIEK